MAARDEGVDRVGSRVEGYEKERRGCLPQEKSQSQIRKKQKRKSAPTVAHNPTGLHHRELNTA